MRAFITGGLGQIGSHIAEMLLDRGDKVVVLDNLETGRAEHLPQHENLTVTIGSIANKELVDQQMEEFQPDVVVHTAASYKDPDDWHSDTMTQCVGGSNIVRVVKKFNVKRFVYYQTALCYGLSPQQSPIRLDHPRKPKAATRFQKRLTSYTLSFRG